ncbi:MAG: DUF1289 domain-containing protein [Gallionella sp.]|jgi:predicted Fe-S protein YdhL (DUF1289 family)
MTETKDIAKSPCLGDCNPNDDGVCLSCFLTTKENDQWNHISNEERLAILENAKQRQQAKSAG